MDSLSDNLKIQFKLFLQLWLQERGDYSELHVISTNVILEAPDRIESIDVETILNVSEKKIILDKCKQDLMRSVDYSYQLPDYVVANEDERLQKLIQIVKQSSFRRTNVHDRLKVYFYLGEILSLRGWVRKDNQLLQHHFGERSAKEVKKTAKRVFELFNARGIYWLTSVMYIKPTYLAQMEETDFYEILLPEARQLRHNEMLIE